MNQGKDQDTASTDRPSSFAVVIAALLSARQSGRHFVELLAASIRLAAMSGVSILITAIVASALLIVMWVLVVSVIGYAAVQAGLPWIPTGLILAFIHLVVAALLVRRAFVRSRDLTLPAVRKVIFQSNKSQR